MKAKILFCLLASCLLALAGWLVRGQNPAQADDVPEKYRGTVHKGLEYLVKNQFKDGHWEGDGGQHPVAMTGLVGITLLLAGSRNDGGNRTIREGKYSDNVRKAVDWLIDKSLARRDGLLFSEHPSEADRYMQGHGLATLFLAGACAQENDQPRREKLTLVLTRAVKYILKAQSSLGGWYHTSKVEGHDLDVISATVIQMQALYAAENAGIPVPFGTTNYAHEYLAMALKKYETTVKSGQNRSRPAETAAALACLSRASSVTPENEWCAKWFKYCQTEIPVRRGIQLGRDELPHYYLAQAMFYRGGGTWNDYRTALFDQLQSRQNKDGSWQAGDGISVGPVYSTAVWCTILQLDRRSHPVMRPEPVDIR